MRRFLFMVMMIVAGSIGYSQQNQLSLSGGYVFANVEDIDVSAQGWRINGLYEYIVVKNKFSHGFSFGYAEVKADSNGVNGKTTYKIGSVPLYYAPKYLIGSGNLKGFVKAALGIHFSYLKRSGTLGSVKGDDFGITAGGAVGGMYFLSEKFFTNLEYELLWQSNTYFRDGLVNSASIGIGIRF